ncbi:hypothetical protein IEO21_00460 [Rhodonia placenta]|uniref:Defective in cullin neddylation protein n=1 Tax=Rhodonia placenta TaxID=104341 RepID=A0A8H7U6Q3_9APHY|nr:hypothetical protein IEO21_00460 [Postia placenta]
MQRKRAGDTTVETTRATRSSTRIKTPATDSAEQMDAIEETPVTKKIRKAASKATTSRSRGRGKAQAVYERTENPQPRPRSFLHDAVLAGVFFHWQSVASNTGVTVFTRSSNFERTVTGQEDTVAPAGSKSKQTKSSKPEAYSAQRAAALYSNYVDPDEPSVIGPEGFERLCSDMDISLEGALPLILAWQMKASEMAKITRSEWDVATAELQ